MKSFSFKKFMSSTTDYRDILHNRAVLYIIFFIALVNVFILTTLGDWTYVSIFFLVGFLTSFFSKNMVVILFFAITVTNLLKYGSAAGPNHGSLEGFDGTSKDDENSKDLHKNNEKKDEASATVTTTHDTSSTYTKEDLEDRKEIMTIQKELLDKMQTMEPFFEKMSKLQEKMTTKKEGMKKV